MAVTVAAGHLVACVHACVLGLCQRACLYVYGFYVNLLELSKPYAPFMWLGGVNGADIPSGGRECVVRVVAPLRASVHLPSHAWLSRICGMQAIACNTAAHSSHLQQLVPVVPG